MGVPNTATPLSTDATVKLTVSPMVGLPKERLSTSRVNPPAVSGFDTAVEGGVCPTPILGGAGGIEGCEVFVVLSPMFRDEATLRINVS